MKSKVADFVVKCLISQQVKPENRRHSRLLQPLISEWKWDHITTEIVAGFPRSTLGHDVVCVVVDRLNNSAHFIPYRFIYSMDKNASFYIQKIVRLQ